MRKNKSTLERERGREEEKNYEEKELQFLSLLTGSSSLELDQVGQ